MKKGIKLLLYLSGVLLLLLLLIIVFHSSIISFSLQKIIFNKSEGKVELTLNSFQIKLIESAIIIDKPTLVLQDIYTDESKNVKVDSIVFENIEIDKLDLLKLFLKRNIMAGKILIDKPQFWLTEQGTESKSSFHPDKLIKILNQNPDMFSKMIFRIDNIEIHYGSVMMSEYTAENADPGLVDFTIMLENFDSHPTDSTNTNRILFSEEFRFRLKDLHNTLKSGYTLDVDSAIFSSNHRDLIIGGVSLQPSRRTSDQNSIGIRAGQIKLNDISLEEVRGLEDLSLRSIILADGEFINFNNVKSNSDTSSGQGLDQLTKLLYDFRLDSIDISNFNYLNIRNFKDTLIIANDIEFLMTEIEIDSCKFIDLFHNLHFNRLNLSTGSFAIDQLIPETKINYGGLFYSNADENLRLTNIQFQTFDEVSKSRLINLEIPEFNILGGNLHDLQKRKKQYLSIKIVDPVGNIDLSSVLKGDSSAPKKLVFPDHLILDKIILSNGDFNISKTGDFFISLSGLSAELDGLSLPETTDDQFSYKQISFAYNNIDSYFEKPSLGIITGGLSYQANQLAVNNIRFKTQSIGKDGLAQIRKIRLNDFDLDQLVFENKFILGQLTINKPQFKGEVLPGSKKPDTQQTPFLQKLSPLAFNVGEIVITEGKIDAEISLQKDSIKLSTTYDLSLGSMSLNKGDSLSYILRDLLWNIKLTDVTSVTANHTIKSSQILTDAFRSDFTINDLSIAALPAALNDDEKIAIRNLSIPLLHISGLDYDLLINRDSLSFTSILLDSLDGNIRLQKPSSKIQSINNSKLDLRDYFIFSYDSINTNNLHIAIEKPGDSSNTNFWLKDFNLIHHFTTKDDNNLMNNIGLSFSEFSQYDSLANKFLSIHGGHIDLDDNNLVIESIRGGNIIDEVGYLSAAGSSGMLYQSDNISLTNIKIEESLPSKLSIGKLFIGDIDFHLKQVPNKKKKTSLKIDLELMDRFSKIMTRMQVDTARLEDISLTYQTIEDTSMHTIDFDSISLVVHKIDIDTAMIGQSRPNLINKLTVDLHGRTMITHDSLYEIQTGQLHYDFPNHKITLDSLHMIPRYDEESFFEKAVYQATRAKLFSRKIEINNLNVDELFNNDHIHLENIKLTNLNAELYRNKRYPIKPGTFKKLPREGLMGISQKFTVDSIQVIDSYLKYKQIEDKSFVPGEIFFNDLNAEAFNFTNMLQEGERLNLKIDAYGRIMDNARMDVNIFFPLHKDSTAFWLAAKTETIDLTVLNSMTENLLGLGITRGVGSIDAQFISANDSLARGDLIFRYKKLQLKRYNRKKSQLKKKGFINFLINDLVVKSNNPKFARKPRVGQVYFVRETEKGVVAYLFRSLLTGLTSTLGFNNKEQRMERKEDKKKE